MSDADDVSSIGRLAIQSSRLEPLRNRMETFVSEHETRDDLQTLRERASEELSLSEVVDENRDGRLD